MTKNLGNIDKTLRVIVGLALISLVFIGPKTPYGWVGAVLIVTAIFSFCPLYRILGIRTCKV